MAEYINREDVYYALQILRKQDHPKEIKTNEDVIADALSNTIETTIDYVKKAVGVLPAADVRENVRGEWIFEKGDGKTCVDGWYCSNCKHGFHTNVPYFSDYNYCPNCGADMRGTK